ncbi:hypothetical protein D9Q98_008776 [Chlorella vulgaris]|uniref:Glycosyl transferase family 1 domain-containing protein n=1 Tax=Chlorella vulgaris TaxID=3077 RepID=A0A9D4YUE9_CHLVU|nr:hypothetical protein D9Q98_008776 [Chlorella vulgaris]
MQGPAAGTPPPPLLPFGDTLHYAGCGCPSFAPGCRLCDWGDSWLRQAYTRLGRDPVEGQLVRLTPNRTLKIAFCLPHANVTGGLKILLEQMRLLRQRGHAIVALTRSEVVDQAVPSWSDVAVDADVVCRLNQRFRDVYDVDSCDVVVTGIFHQVPEWLVGTSAPIVYFEQGHEWLFGDPVRFTGAGRAQDSLFHQAMHLPVALAAVSEAVQTILGQEFGRTSMLVHNSVDCTRFTPGPLAAAALAQPCMVLCSRAFQPPADGERRPSVLLVGNPGLPLKGFERAIATLGRVHRQKPIEVVWVCQQQPCSQLAGLIDRCGLRVSLHINPPQDQLPALYRGHDCFLFTSRYEAWGMPVLEAMASGLAVVATEIAGVRSFASHNLNCLLAPPASDAGLALCVLSLLDNAPLRTRLATAAWQTAQCFTADRVVEQLERALYSMTACRQELLALRLQALPDVQLAAAAAVTACAGVAAAQQAQLKARQDQQRRAVSAPEVPAPPDAEHCNTVSLPAPQAATSCDVEASSSEVVSCEHSKCNEDTADSYSRQQRHT